LTSGYPSYSDARLGKSSFRLFSDKPSGDVWATERDSHHRGGLRSPILRRKTNKPRLVIRVWCRAILKQTVVQARKLGLLRKQKFRSRTRAKVAAGANERVCGECPTPYSSSWKMRDIQLLLRPSASCANRGMSDRPSDIRNKKGARRPLFLVVQCLVNRLRPQPVDKLLRRLFRHKADDEVNGAAA
jgi:hypothetical protein